MPLNIYNGFTDDRVLEYFISNVKRLKNVELNIDFSDAEIKHIIADGANQNFFITMYATQVSIFAINEHFMFIETSIRNKLITSSDTEGEIVYEGEVTLNRNHETLDLVFKIFELAYGATSIKHRAINSGEVTLSGYDKKYNYEIDIINPYIDGAHEIQYNNFLFRVNYNR